MATSHLSLTAWFECAALACVHMMTASAKGSPLATPYLNSTGDNSLAMTLVVAEALTPMAKVPVFAMNCLRET